MPVPPHLAKVPESVCRLHLGRKSADSDGCDGISPML